MNHYPPTLLFLFFLHYFSFSSIADTLYFRGEKSNPILTELPSLHGELKQIDNHVVHWQHPNIDREIKIDLDTVYAIRQENKQDQEIKKGHTLYLITGDKLIGEMVSIEEKALVFRLLDGQEITIERDLVEKLKSPNVKPTMQYYQYRNGKKMIFTTLLGEKDKNQIALVNNRILTGKIKEAAHGLLILRIGDKEREIALSEINEICFQKRRTDKKNKGTASQFTFAGGSKLKMTLTKIDTQQVQGKIDFSQKEFTFKKEHLEEILFVNKLNKKASHNAILNFQNGDQLSGNLRSIRDGKVVWDGEHLLDELQIDTEHLKTCTFLHAKSRNQTHISPVYLHLTNGDRWEGEIKDFGEEFVRIDTSYGSIKTKRSYIKDIWLMKDFSSLPSITYSGPNRTDRWQQKALHTQRTWFYKGGALQTHSPGLITKKIDIPDKVTIVFTLEWTHHMGRLKFILFSDKGKHLSQSNRYTVDFIGKETDLSGFSTGNSMKLDCWLFDTDPTTNLKKLSKIALGEEPIPEFNEKASRIHVKIYADKKKQEITLVINDRVVNTWKDPHPKEMFGNTIGFDLSRFSKLDTLKNHSSSPLLKIRNITVSHWDGVLPKKKGDPKKITQDTLFLNNADRVDGKVTHLDSEKVTIQVAKLSEPIAIPREKVMKIALSRKEEDKGDTLSGNISVVFRDGGDITLQLEELKGNHLKGKSPAFGPFVFNLEDIKQIEFHPHTIDK